MSERRQQVLFVALYPGSQAGTRLRALAWFPALEAQGLDCSLWTFVTAHDSPHWFGASGPLRRVLITFKGLLRAVRLWMQLPRYDVVVVLREALPLATTALERRAAARCRVVWDVDDALWVSYPRMFFPWMPERLRRSERKYERLASLAHEVWAGGSEIATWCRRHSTSVWTLPTVPVSPDAVPNLERRAGLVWVGSQSTAPFLEQLLPHLGPLPSEVAVTALGARCTSPPGLTVHWTEWSEQAESAALSRARVGLYPLDTSHPLAGPRAGFKAALYMAHGLPAIATPIAAVAEMMRDGIEGFHAATPAQWASHVATLLADDVTWARMSAAARERATTAYSTEVWAPQVAGRLASLAGHLASSEGESDTRRTS